MAISDIKDSTTSIGTIVMPDTTASPAPAASSRSYDNSTSTAGRMAQNSFFERFARAGFVVSGIVHLIIGYIAIRLAVGGAAGTADQSGAMTELAAKPGGIAALWVGVVAFAIMGLWRLAEAALGSSSAPDADSTKSEVINRLKAFALAVVYFSLAFSALGFARGSGRSSSGQSAGITAGLMQTTPGTIALVTCALVIIAVGGYHIYKGVAQKFLDRPHRYHQPARATPRHGRIHRERAGHRRHRSAGDPRRQPIRARQGRRTRRRLQDPRRATLRSCTPRRGRHRHHHLRSLQLRHGALHQNVTGHCEQPSGTPAQHGRIADASRECRVRPAFPACEGRRRRSRTARAGPEPSNGPEGTTEAVPR